ncbi:hypothetical protein MIND_00957400 [Mycena indigotica]|uniref:Uncharacterized protein n=1 Tax=Mycena indigotica TaxID=2126181 RepID=A0A8H6W0M9_9AGAR|nr:uncharacterized protein MIND_00957400 [Mycena indigotica]KAF7297243.1 hypothetical protein MIND_00957400 [Mycena indigotica]
MSKELLLGQSSPRPRSPGHNRPLVFAGCLLAILYFAWPYRSNAHKVGTITWGLACDRPHQECGSIIVPKDYLDLAAGTATIAISRIRATWPKQGTVFMNPGGPGGPGTWSPTLRAAALVGGQWDLVGFDPRGIHRTTPQVKCFPNSDHGLFQANTVLERGLTVPSIRNLSDPAVEAALEVQIRELTALRKAEAEMCTRNVGEELKYVGTTTVVRDIAFMADVLEGKGSKINLYAGSYGSIIGTYLVNMLPERAGRVVIDGIVDPVRWSNEPMYKWPLWLLASTEKTYRFFLETCAEAGPTRCPISYELGEDHKVLEARFESFFDKLALEPLPVTSSQAFRPGLLTSGAARGLLLGLLGQPPQWQFAAQAFAEAFSGNGTLLYNQLVAPDATSESPFHDLVNSAVICADVPSTTAADIPSSAELAEEHMRVLREVSPHFGAVYQDAGCEYWPTSGRGPERFAGPWNATLETPMLIVSNTMDPISPGQAGLRINQEMGNSTRLIIQDGPGHCASSLPTPCTRQLITEYFAGTVPANGTTCVASLDYFPSQNGSVPVELDDAQMWGLIPGRRRRT